MVAHPAGILGGVDHQFTGRVERVDVALLQSLLERDIVPVVPPLGFDGEGHTYRLNSDAVAVEVALALRAVKLIYLGPHPGVPVGATEPIRQVSVAEAELLLKKPPAELPAGVRSKLDQAVRAARGGVPRVHIIDGRVQEGLLAEVFSYEGIGTLVYANEYQAIRPAQKKDVRAIYALIQNGVRNDELLQRTRAEIERQIGDFYVFEVDRSPVGCVALHFYPGYAAGRAGLPVRRRPLREPGHRRQADAVRRNGRPRAGGRTTVLPEHADVQLLRAEGRLPARHAGRPAAGPPGALRAQRPAVASACQDR